MKIITIVFAICFGYLFASILFANSNPDAKKDASIKHGKHGKNGQFGENGEDGEDGQNGGNGGDGGFGWWKGGNGGNGGNAGDEKTEWIKEKNNDSLTRAYSCLLLKKQRLMNQAYSKF